MRLAPTTARPITASIMLEGSGTLLAVRLIVKDAGESVKVNPRNVSSESPGAIRPPEKIAVCMLFVSDTDQPWVSVYVPYGSKTLFGSLNVALPETVAVNWVQVVPVSLTLLP